MTSAQGIESQNYTKRTSQSRISLMLSSMCVSQPHILSVIVTPIIQVFVEWEWEWEVDGEGCKG